MGIWTGSDAQGTERAGKKAVASHGNLQYLQGIRLDGRVAKPDIPKSCDDCSRGQRRLRPSSKITGASTALP